MEFEAKVSAKVDDGLHMGSIARVEYRHNPYEYTDIIVNVEDDQGNIITQLSYGCPSVVTPDSKLGRLLTLFGAKIVPGEKVHPDKIILGTEDVVETYDDTKKIHIVSYIIGKEVKRKVKFMTINEPVKGKDGSTREYARIAEGSLKLI